MTRYKIGDFINIKHFVKMIKSGEERYLYSRIGIVTDVLTGNVQLTLNTSEGSLDLVRIGATDDFFDEITGIHSRFEIIK